MNFKRKYQNTVEKFLSGDAGRRFFQIFYSVGAAIVIIGALAKITHWPYNLGNVLLTAGLLTEFLVFLISAFDAPDKDYQWERVFPVLDTNDADDRPAFGNGAGLAAGVKGAAGGTVIIGGGIGSARSETGAGVSEVAAGGTGSGGTVVIGGGIEANSNALAAGIKKIAAAAEQLGKMAEVTDATQQYLDKLTEMSENMSKFSSVTNSLTDVSDVLLNSYKSITDNSDGLNRSACGYVHQVEALNRNIQGLNTIYEIQLKSVSSQIDAIERINSGLMRIKDLYEGSIVDSSVFRSETEKMAQQLHTLNDVYNRLLNAMTLNMYGTGNNPLFNSPYTPAAGTPDSNHIS
ncbi:MAG: gliding motility protein GldL [Dysgonamonadaceae bacterium]|nr:gliding motility protein GldL [Dysgonamonadaceae bacterium]